MDDKQLNLPATKDALKQFEFNYQEDKKSGIQRYSNHLLHILESLDVESLRFYKFVCDHMNLYPLELLEDPEFLDCMEKGEKVLRSKYRTVRISAADYAARFYPNQLLNGRKAFTKHAISLYEAEIELQKDLSDDELAMGSLRILNNIVFVVKRRQQGKAFDEKLTFKDLKEGKACQASEIVIELTDKIALQSMFMRRNFTRIDQKISSHLSARAEKFYSSLKMMNKILLLDKARSVATGYDTFVKEAPLDYWNTFCNTKHKTVRRFLDSFKVPNELTEKTELFVTAEGFSSTGKKQNDSLRLVWYARNIAHYEQLSDPVKKTLKPTRKLKRRPPKIKPGSDLEGAWARENIKILLNYELELQRIGNKLLMVDVKRLNRYYKIIGETGSIRPESK